MEEWRGSRIPVESNEHETHEPFEVYCFDGRNLCGAEVPDEKYDKCNDFQSLLENSEFLPRIVVSSDFVTGDIKDYLISDEVWEEIKDSGFHDGAVELTDTADTEIVDDWPDETGTPEHGKPRRRGGRRHKGHFMKRPMALSEVIEELQHPDLRENALRCLSGHLIERREQDGEFYRQAGYFLFYSCGTVAVLLQEVLAVYERIYAGDLKIRGSKRLSNVLTLLQSIAANEETRLDFIRACIPNYLLPFIMSEYTEEVYENVRAISLSVIGVLCQARDIRIIKWALESDIIEVCFYAMEIGSELSKVISMTILESILRKHEGLSAICDPSCDLLPRFLKICADFVSILAVAEGFSPRLLFLVVRCLIFLCQNRRALDILRNQLPHQLQDNSFHDLKEEFPVFGYLRHQLLLNTGKARDYLPSVPTPNELKSRSLPSSDLDKEGSPKTMTILQTVDAMTPMRPIDLDKHDWSTFLRSPSTTS